MEEILILDATGFVFRAYFALPEMRNPAGESVHAVFGFVRSVLKLVKSFSPQKMIAVFDAPDNKQSRQAIYPEYKSHRVLKFDDLPAQIQLAKSFCSLFGLNYLEEPSVEADDVIGSLTRLAVSEGYKVGICSGDKDLLQLVGRNVSVINPWKNNERITEETVLQKFGIAPQHIADYLALVGDTSDNIPGVHGCGPKKAVKLLKAYGSLEAILDNIEALSPSDRKIFQDHQEIATVSKRLALLNKDIPLSLSVADLKFPMKTIDVGALNDFYKQQGFNTLIDLKSPAQNCNVQVTIVQDAQAVADLVNRLKGKQVCFAAAYLGELLLSLKCVGLALAESQSGVYYVDFSLHANDLIQELNQLFGDKDTTFYGYNVKRDVHALTNLGINIQSTVYDLVLVEHLLNKGAKVSFQRLLTRLGLDDSVHISIKPWGDQKLPILKLPEEPEQYFGTFVSYLPAMKEVLFKELSDRQLNAIFFDIEAPLEHVLFDMERAGMPIDLKALQRLEIMLSQDLKDVTEEIYAMVGKHFNIKSPKQLSEILYEHLGIKPVDKLRSTKAEILESLKDQHDVINKILAYRSTEKLLSTYVKALPKQVDPATQRIHPTFNQTGTVTGRLSCQDPNLQNIPIRTEKGKILRATFACSRPGYSFLSADYSQIELRFLAHLSGDECLRDAFLSDEDVHSFTASQIFHVPIQQVSDQQRSQAKIVNFGIVYGQQAFGLSKILKISVTEAQALIDAYFARYVKVAEFIADTIECASKNQQVTTLLGRERIIEGWNESTISKAAAGRLAVNTRLQGSAAELIKLAMLSLTKEMRHQNLLSRLLLQIHDELIFEVPDDELEKMQALVQEKMEAAMALLVPLKVNILIGKNWAEC